MGYLGLGGPVIGVGFLAVTHGLLSATRLVAVVIAALCVVLVPLIFTEVGRRAASRGTGTGPSRSVPDGVRPHAVSVDTTLDEFRGARVAPGLVNQARSNEDQS